MSARYVANLGQFSALEYDAINDDIIVAIQVTFCMETSHTYKYKFCMKCYFHVKYKHGDVKIISGKYNPLSSELL